MASRQLGSYEVVERIGAGGMGEVFRAHDARLGRDVALKLLPGAFSQDADRLARFEREARLLAALNHPGIGAIYGLEVAEGQRFLVLELVEGEDLSERISRGALSVDEALPIARDIAEAVEFAHEQGVIHRDLKPANVKITPEGRVKVLDFGLAKALDSDDPSDPRLSQSPTIMHSSPTIAGVILGTAAYMSPEQARGKKVDKRSDVFAFGCLVYEMLAGKQAFEGDTISDTLAAVLKTQPDMDALPSNTPRVVRDLLKRCLEKDPKLRLRDIGEARIAIDHARHTGPDESTATPAIAPPSRGKRDLVWGAALLVVAAVAFFGARQMSSSPVEAPLRKFVIDQEDDVVSGRYMGLALSPDGSRIAFVCNNRIWVRDLARTEPVELAGTDDADCPVFSPDGSEIAYRSGRSFHRISAQGGTPTLISATNVGFSGGTAAWWTHDDRILFSSGTGPMMQVSARGGDPVAVAPLSDGVSDIHEASELPDGRGFLYVAHLASGGPCEIHLLTADGQEKTLLRVESQRLWTPRYSTTGHVLYRRTGNNEGVWALPFSLSKLEVTGEPFLVALNGAEPCPGPNGLLVYSSGDASPNMEITILSDQGKVESKIGEPYEIAGGPALSPDGNRLAAVISENSNGDIWVFDLKRGTRTRLTFDPGWDIEPSWSRDGQFIYYTNASRQKIYEVPADGSESPRFVRPGFYPSISTDGKWMSYELDDDLFVVPFPCDTNTVGTPLVATQAIERMPCISPDGKYIAYTSNESGLVEVYLTRFPEAGGKWQVSTQGGSRPAWDRAGGAFFYSSPTQLMRVDVTTTPSLQLGSPQPVFLLANARVVMGRTSHFAVFPGGKRFVFICGSGDTESKPHVKITVAENWVSEFKTTKKK